MSILEFQVVDSGNQIKAQTKPVPPIAIALTQDAKDFQLANNVLNQYAFSRQGAIAGFLLCAQWVQLGVLDWSLAVGMDGT